MLQASVDDYQDVLRKYIYYIDTTGIIIEFINSCGEPDLDLEDDFKSISSSFGQYRFALGDTEEEEVINVYSILKYMSEKYKDIPRGIMLAYSSSSLKEGLKSFNDSVTMVLIRHIDVYLIGVGIDMGLDENVTYNIKGGQVNISNDNSTLNAVQNNGIDVNELSKLISEMRNALDENLSDEEKEEANDSIDIIENELKSEHPDEKNVKTHFKFLKKIDSGVKFINSCLALVTFADKVFPFLSQIPTWLGVQ